MQRPTYSRHHPGKNILAIDCETSGIVFGDFDETFKQYQVVSFGLIIADSETFAEVDSCYVEIKFDGSKYKWDDGAEAVHGLSVDHLASNGETSEGAAETIANFLFPHFGTGKVCVLGHNTYFDICGLRQILSPFGVMPDLHHVVIDTSPLGFITTGIYKSNDLFQLFGAEARGKHNALDDARQALAVARGIKELVQAGLDTV